MTYMVPATAGTVGYVASVSMGHPIAGIFVGIACAGMGFLGRFAGHGLHINRSQMRKVDFLMHRAMAANWGVRPLAMRYTDEEQQRLVGSVFDSVAGEPIQQLVEQWPVIWAHIQRVHFTGIVPLASLKRMKRFYRPGIFGKDVGKATELAQPVAMAYATLHPAPEQDRDWFMRWAASIGLAENFADRTWSAAMAAREASRRKTEPVDVPEPQAPEDLTDEEIDRRMAASRS